MQQQLIENALALCGKTMEDMTETYIFGNTIVKERFSIEKFGWYLLDRQFIIKYYENKKPGYMPSIETTDLMAGEFGYAIMEYQSGNETPLVELLTKIKGK